VEDAYEIASLSDKRRKIPMLPISIVVLSDVILLPLLIWSLAEVGSTIAFKSHPPWFTIANYLIIFQGILV
jgi:hypothetical protein